MRHCPVFLTSDNIIIIIIIIVTVIYSAPFTIMTAVYYNVLGPFKQRIVTAYWLCTRSVHANFFSTFFLFST